MPGKFSYAVVGPGSAKCFVQPCVSRSSLFCYLDVKGFIVSIFQLSSQSRFASISKGMLKNFTTLYLILKEKDHQQGYPLDWIEAIGSVLKKKRVVVIDADNNSQSVEGVKEKQAQKKDLVDTITLDLDKATPQEKISLVELGLPVVRRPELMVATDEGVSLSKSSDSGFTKILPGVYVPQERPAFFGEWQVKRRLSVLKIESDTALNSVL